MRRIEIEMLSETLSCPVVQVPGRRFAAPKKSRWAFTHMKMIRPNQGTSANPACRPARQYTRLVYRIVRLPVVMSAALFLLSLMISTCASAEIPTSELLVGSWQNTNVVKQFTTDLTFKRDGTFVGKVTQGGKVVWEFGGKWSLKERMLNYDYTASSLARIPVGTKDQDEIIEVTKDYFICQGMITHGGQKKYVRMQ